LSSYLLVSSFGQRRYVASVDQGKLTDLVIAPTESSSVLGNLYKGRVVKVLPGMNTVFVECGLARTACLYGDHIEPASDAPLNRRLHEGQVVNVQVSRDPMGQKGAKITMRHSFVGRLVVFTPTFDNRTVSRRVTDKTERERLMTMAHNVTLDDGGFIVRTAAAGCSDEDMQRDLDAVVSHWRTLSERSASGDVPSLLVEELDATLTTIRDRMRNDVDAIIVDSPAEHQRINDYLSQWMPTFVDRLELHPVRGRLFADHKLEAAIRRVLSRAVWLKSGGSLVFDTTEAMTVVDVNTGRFVGKTDAKTTILTNNKEAATEVATQLRLRNISGLVVVDFIDMEDPSDRRQVTQRMQEALEGDRARINVSPMNDLGLISLSRERLGESVEQSMHASCEPCEGRGWTLTTDELCRRIVADTLHHLTTRNDFSGVCVRAHPEVIKVLTATHQDILNDIQSREGLEVQLEPTEDRDRETFDVVGKYGG
jgi:ribonuclease G